MPYLPVPPQAEERQQERKSSREEKKRKVVRNIWQKAVHRQQNAYSSRVEWQKE